MYKQIVIDTPYRSLESVGSFIDDVNNRLWKKTVECATYVVSKNEKEFDIKNDKETFPFWMELQDAFFRKSDIGLGKAVIKIYDHLLASFPLFSYEPGTNLYDLQRAVFDMHCCFDYIYSSNLRFFEEYFESIRFLPFLEKQAPRQPIITSNLTYGFVEKMMHAIYLASR